MKRYSNDLRQRVVDMYFKGPYTCRQIGILFTISKTTVSRWLTEYRTHSLLISKKTRVKIRHYDVLIQNYVAQRPLTSLYNIKTYLYRRHKMKISTSTISKCLKRLKISHKQVTRQYRSKKATPAKKQKFKTHIKGLTGDVYCLDETGFYLNNCPNKGWSSKGQKCLHRHKILNFKKVSMIMIISKHGIVHHKILDQSLNRNTMMEFLQEIPNIQGHLIMDNLRVHHCREIKAFLNEKNLKPVFNLPYSPELNPIEEVFSVIKRRVRSLKVCGKPKLETVITKIISELNDKLSFDNFYHHAFHE